MLGAHEEDFLTLQGNLAVSYEKLRRLDMALRLRQEVYSGRLKLNGEEHEETLRAANNYADTLCRLQRYAEAKSLMRRLTPVARRVLGEGHRLTLLIRRNYSALLYTAAGASLDDLREAVTTLEDTERIARRVLGGANPTTAAIEFCLRESRAALSEREI